VVKTLSPGANPFKGKLIPLSEEDDFELGRQIESQLKNNVIRHHIGPWGAPVFVIDKKTLISLVVQEVAGHKYYITLDLNWGFWNVPVTPGASDLLSFVCSYGQFAFNVIPFGCKISPSHFQFAVEWALSW